MPDETGSDEAFSGADAGVGYVVKVVKNVALEGEWDERAENGGGGITQEWDIVNCSSGDGKGG
jgi:hypothetical protein